MGLEGDAGSQIIERFAHPQLLPMLSMSQPVQTLTSLMSAEDTITPKSSNITTHTLNETDSGIQLLLQAQALLKKSFLFQKIQEALRKSQYFRPCVYNIPATSQDEDTVAAIHRDTAVQNLRFLNLFYGFGASTFALAVNLFDRLLAKVKGHPRYMACIATTCFLIAAKVLEECPPSAAQLVRLSQCGGSAADLARTERLILDKLHYKIADVTPVTFLHRFVEVLAERDPERFGDMHLVTALAARLEVLLCQIEFVAYRAETLALALISCVLHDSELESEQFASIVELQYYCQISDDEFLHCRGLLLSFLAHYASQRTRAPPSSRALKLVWSVSRRTMLKLKPSTRGVPAQDLDPITEDEADEDGDGGGNDAGPFDSENDDSEMVKQSSNHAMSTGDDHLDIPDLCIKMSMLHLACNGVDDDDDDSVVISCHKVAAAAGGGGSVAKKM